MATANAGRLLGAAAIAAGVTIMMLNRPLCALEEARVPVQPAPLRASDNVGRSDPVDAKQATERSQPKLLPPTPQNWSQFDMTGYWVSVVTEDWAYRMVTPQKGDIGSVPVNKNGKDAANEWRPSVVSAAGDWCGAYGAAGIMRQPGRLHITWQGDWTLRLDFDAGMQTRLFHFPESIPPFGSGATTLSGTFTGHVPPGVPAARQGYSIALWRKLSQARGFLGTSIDRMVPLRDAGGTLMVTTYGMLSGYLQKNGVPYGEKAVLTEYFNRLKLPNGEDWLVVTSIVDDPEYLVEPFVTSTQFKRENDGAAWNPVPCLEK